MGQGASAVSCLLLLLLILVLLEGAQDRVHMAIQPCQHGEDCGKGVVLAHFLGDLLQHALLPAQPLQVQVQTGDGGVQLGHLIPLKHCHAAAHIDEGRTLGVANDDGGAGAGVAERLQLQRPS
jgi:hypothetical protein